jgi:hypothetical protein
MVRLLGAVCIAATIPATVAAQYSPCHAAGEFPEDRRMTEADRSRFVHQFDMRLRQAQSDFARQLRYRALDGLCIRVEGHTVLQRPWQSWSAYMSDGYVRYWINVQDTTGDVSHEQQWMIQLWQVYFTCSNKRQIRVVWSGELDHRLAAILPFGRNDPTSRALGLGVRNAWLQAMEDPETGKMYTAEEWDARLQSDAEEWEWLRSCAERIAEGLQGGGS